MINFVFIGVYKALFGVFSMGLMVYFVFFGECKAKSSIRLT